MTPSKASPDQGDSVPPTAPARILIIKDKGGSDLAEAVERAGCAVVGPAQTLRQAVDEFERPDAALVDASLLVGDVDDADLELVAPIVMVASEVDASVKAAVRRSSVFAIAHEDMGREHLMATVAVAMARHGELVAANGEADGLRIRLEQRKIIEQAKWRLVQTRGITEPEAMKLLQSEARGSRRPLIEIAESKLTES